MTITVREDLIAGAGASISGDGPSATRVFGVEVSASETVFDILGDAGIPSYYDQYPNTGGTGEFAAIYALEISCEPLNEENTFYRVVASYSRPGFSEKDPGETSSDSLIQVGSSVTGSTTQVDKDGAQIDVDLTGQTTQVGTVEVQVPEVVLSFERREVASPITKAIANTGFVNSASLGGGTYAVRTLLCLGIEGVSTDDGESYQVSYRFQYRPATWDAVIAYIDPETDRPHEDIDIGTADGIEVVKVYSEVDFSSLTLNF